MEKEVAEALEGSIKKWKAIVAGTGINEGPQNCPLCQMFITNTDRKGCPVNSKTNKPGCIGTPYDEYDKLEYEDCEGNKAELERLAQAELDFLKSLRE